MALTPQTLFTVGDTAADLTGTCTNGTGTTATAADLTGATLELHLKRPDGTVLTKVAALVLATAGTWKYTWIAGDLNVPGTWQAEQQVTYSNGRIQTFGPFSFVVRQQLA